MKSLGWVFVLVLSFASTAFAQNGGYALKFDGIDGKVTTTTLTGAAGNTMTLEIWFTRVTAQAGTQFLADLHSIFGSDKRRVMPFLNSGVIGIYCAPNTGNDNNAVTQSTGVTASTNVWYHIAVTINGSNIKMYVNGKQYVNTSLTDSYALTGTEILTLASDYWATTYANIKMDEVRVWSTERTEAEIKANMFKELAGNEAGLLSYYKMSDGAGASLSDNQTAGTYDGTISGGTTWTASGAFADNRNALDFDGSNDYVDCGNSASVQRNGTQSLTLEAWVKPTGGQWVAVISKFVHTASNEGYSLEIFTDNKVSLLYGNNWSDWNATTSSTSLTPGVWSHIAATYDGTTVKVYINGLLTQSATWTNGLTDSGTNLLLGARSGTTFYSGQMDEVRVWTVARTEAEIRESMCRTLVGNEAGLAAYYRLDQIDGSTTYDLTSNANHGTLTNMDPSTDWVTSDAFDTWIGAESSSWSNAGNWSKGAVPTSSNSVGFYKWALGNETTISTSPTINNLLASTTASPTLSSAITINMNFVLGKNFNLNGQTVTLGSTATLVEGAYRVYGTSGTIATTRTLSNIAALDVADLGAKISTTANLGSTTITRGHAQQTGNGNVSILRYYDITPTNNSSLNATLVFNYKDAELNSLTENNLKLFRSTDSGTTWTNEGGTVSTANNYVTKTAIPSFSRWTLADSGHPLVLANTTTSVASSANPSINGQSVTFTATVNESDPLTPTGTVTFKDGAATLGTGPLNGSGQATFTTNALSVGAHNITAEYGGDANFNGSTSPGVSHLVISKDYYYFLYVFRAGTGSGKVTGSGIDCGSDCTECYPECLQVELTATPDTDSIFSGWSGDCSGTEMTTGVRMCSTKFCTATFMLRPYTITASARTGGSISPSGSVTVTHGGNQTFTIIPENNYLIFNVKVDGVSVGAIPGYTFTHVAANHTIEAEFKAKASGIFASPSPVDFGGVVVGTQSTRNIILGNTGNVDITITSVLLGGMSPLVSSTGFLNSLEGGGFSMGDGCRGKTLSPSRGCIIGVTFLPEGGGAQNAWITINSTDSAFPSFDIPLIGRGIDRQKISVSPGSIEFGEVLKGQRVSRVITITNSGTGADLLVGGITIVLGEMFPLILTSTCAGQSITVLGRCSFGIEYGPMAAQTIVATKVQISSNDPDNPVETVNISGRGVAQETFPFSDIAQDHWAREYIEAVTDAGIITGCTEDRYCPDDLVTREEAAVFIIRALEGEPADEYCATGAPFSDVSAGDRSCKYIKRMRELDITKGCGSDYYCPKEYVSRWQMAVLLIRALEGDPTTDYCGSGSSFVDVGVSYPFCRHIERLYQLGITRGCGGGNYCPDDYVTRAQMAVFLARAFLEME